MDIQGILNAVQSSGLLNRAADNAGATPGETQDVVQGALAHVDEGGGMENIVESVAQRAGVDPSIVSQILPHVLPMLESHFGGAEGAPSAGPAGGLMGMLGGFLNRGA